MCTIECDISLILEVFLYGPPFPPAHPTNNGDSLTSTLSTFETYYRVTYIYLSSINLTRPSRKGGVSIYVHKKYDYVEKPKINITIKRIKCLVVEVMSHTKTKTREKYWSA